MPEKENNKEKVQLTEPEQFGVALVRGTWKAGLELVQDCSLHRRLW